MEVYLELAFAENFLLDALLLFLALKCARGRIGVLRLLLAAAVGAAEAIVFPLLTLPVWAAYLIKFLGGVLIAIIAVKQGSAKTYIVATVSFFALTFALGGMLTAIYSFFDVPYLEGNGYIVEKAPIGLIVGGAGFFGVAAILAAKRFFRYRSIQKNLFSVGLTHAGKSIRAKGFADSGNCLTFGGAPVCVLSPPAALALFGNGTAREGILRIQTVNGEKESPVFRCARMTVGNRNFENVFFTVGQTSKEYQIILHTAYVEGDHEHIRRAAVALTKDPR